MIQKPGDVNQVTLHRDSPPNSPYEIVVWVPLTRVFKTKNMYILEKKESIKLVNNLRDLKNPPIRLGVADKPTPSSRGLIPGHYPDAVTIVQDICLSLKVDSSLGLKAVNIATDQRKKNPIDTPHPSFKGPF